MLKSKRVVVLVLSLLVFSLLFIGQASAVCCRNVTGYVINSLGLPLQNTRIDISNNYTFTDGSGYYNITGLWEGTYTTLARAIGYTNQSNMSVIDADTIINFTLNEKGAGGMVSAPGFEIGIVFISIVVIYCIRQRR